MRTFLLRWLINALALALAVTFVPGLHFQGTWAKLALVALIFGVVNAVLKPLLKILTCPLIAVTLGLFTLVINAVLLMITARLSQHFDLNFSVDSFWAALIGGIVVGIVSTVLALFIPDPNDDD